jgi:hypothetical protein
VRWKISITDQEGYNAMPRIFFRVFAVFLMSLAGLTAQTNAPAAGLTGQVVDGSGQAVAGVRVSYRRRVQFASDHAGHLRLAAGEVRAAGVVVSDAGGEFAIAGLPQGDYVVCADRPSGGYLDPCKWANPLLVTSLAPNEVRSLGLFILPVGAVLTVRLTDATGLLAASAAGAPGGGPVVGAQLSPGNVVRALVVSSGSSEVDYQVTVPYNTALGLWVFSRDLSMKDSNGNSLAREGAIIPIEVSPGDGPGALSVTLTVAGKL